MFAHLLSSPTTLPASAPGLAAAQPLDTTPPCNPPAKLSLDLAAGEPPEPQHLARHPHWRLARGALRVDRHGHAGPPSGLLLPGDLLPLGLAPGWATQHRLQALVATRLVPATEPMPHLLAQALAQQWQRQQDMTALRTGAVPERIKHLMLRLAEAHGLDAGSANQALRLPRVRDIADLVDTTPESVSRTMSALKRLDLLAERCGTRTRFDADRLQASALPQGLTRSVPATGPRARRAALAAALPGTAARPAALAPR